MVKIKNINILAQPRSAGTYMKLFFKKVFPKAVVRHKHNGVNCDVLVLRDIRDSIMSRLRLNGDIIIKTEGDIDKIVKSKPIQFLIKSNRDCATAFKNKNDRTIVLFYEEFIENPKIIFNEIEKWGHEFSDEKKEMIIESLSPSKTKKIINHPSWGTKHVGDGKSGKWREIVPENLQEYFCKSLGLTNKNFTDKEDYFL